MPKNALFPGSFDPITIGHTDIIERSLPLFDQVIIGIGNNKDKEYLFSVDQRLEWIRTIYEDYDKVSVKAYDGMTIKFCEQVGAQYMIRGIRSAADFEFEKTVAQLNRSMNENIETILMLSKPEYSHISSTIVREIIINQGDISAFVPEVVNESV
jgi:pantetheine-phosphate adenylyltransferase